MKRRDFLKGAAATAAVVPVIAEAQHQFIAMVPPRLAHSTHDMQADFAICRRCGATAEMLEDNLVTAPCGPESHAQVLRANAAMLAHRYNNPLSTPAHTSTDLGVQLLAVRRDANTARMDAPDTY